MFRIGHYTGHVYADGTSMLEMGECYTIIKGSVETFDGSLEALAADLHDGCIGCLLECPQSKGTINVMPTLQIPKELMPRE